MIKIVIPLNPVTKKNSQRIMKSQNGGRYIAPSEIFKNYQDMCWIYLRDHLNAGINDRVNVKALYYRQTKRKVDLINLHSALHDVLVHYGVLEDDDSKIIAGTDGSRVFYDKNNPRTEIFIEILNE